MTSALLALYLHHILKKQ